MRAAIASRIAARPRDEWAALFEPTDACVAPVLSLGEAPTHPHNRARRTHVETDGLTRPAPAPRFSRTPAAVSPQAVRDVASTLRAFGIDESEAEHLASEGIVGR